MAAGSHYSFLSCLSFVYFIFFGLFVKKLVLFAVFDFFTIYDVFLTMKNVYHYCYFDERKWDKEIGKREETTIVGRLSPHIYTIEIALAVLIYSFQLSGKIIGFWI